MTKEELWRELDSQGIQYDKRWSVAKLEELAGKKKIKEATLAVEQLKELAQKSEELVDTIIHEDNGKILTKGGLLEIPPEVLNNLKPTQWHYYISAKTPYSVSVSKTSKAGREQFIREYNQEDHGERFNELAKEFINKNN